MPYESPTGRRGARARPAPRARNAGAAAQECRCSKPHGPQDQKQVRAPSLRPAQGDRGEPVKGRSKEARGRKPLSVGRGIEKVTGEWHLIGRPPHNLIEVVQFRIHSKQAAGGGNGDEGHGQITLAMAPGIGTQNTQSNIERIERGPSSLRGRRPDFAVNRRAPCALSSTNS